MIEENCREVRNDLVGLNIWWNLSILRDTYEGRWTNHDSKIQQKGKAVSCRFNDGSLIPQSIYMYQAIVVGINR